MGQRDCSLGGCPLKPSAILITALLVSGALSVYAFPLRINGLLSGTRFFSLDGKWYSVGKTSSINSLLREELRKQGIDVNRFQQLLFDSDKLDLDILSKISPRSRSRSSLLPSCLHVENNMGMETGLGFLDIISGKIAPKGTYARKVLAAKEWTFVHMDDHAAPLWIGSIRDGRETAIVFLEEKEGNFLYVRQLEK